MEAGNEEEEEVATDRVAAVGDVAGVAAAGQVDMTGGST